MSASYAAITSTASFRDELRLYTRNIRESKSRGRPKNGLVLDLFYYALRILISSFLSNSNRVLELFRMSWRLIPAFVADVYADPRDLDAEEEESFHSSGIPCQVRHLRVN